MTKKTICLIGIILLITSCDSNSENGRKDNFNRQTVLINWADNIIIPSYKAFQEKVIALKQNVDLFNQNSTKNNLQQLRTVWVSAYASWQHVAMFEIGPAEDLDFRKFMNIYPTNASNITTYVVSGNYNLERVSLYDEQGFPALGYLLNGLGNSDDDILSFYTSNVHASKYKKYLVDLVYRMDYLTNKVLSMWIDGYRDTFVKSDGMSASSSLNRMTNDYVSYYEKVFRTGKIGIPTGLFSGNILPEKVEGYYKKDISKQLFKEALKALQDFFNGTYFSNSQTGESLKSYLDYLNSKKGNIKLSEAINTQFESIKKLTESLTPNFSEQIKIDKTIMEKFYNELQINTILLKVDMLQAININVDYTDFDGD